jgi:hypothetical protein
LDSRRRQFTPLKYEFWGAYLAQIDDGTTALYAIEPFNAGLFNHALSPSAYPPDRSRGLLPVNIYFGWVSAERDGDAAVALRQSTAAVRSAALADGQDVADAAIYGNGALFGTPVEDIYGANVPRLREIWKRVDPMEVMSLAGGFKL